MLRGEDELCANAVNSMHKILVRRKKYSEIQEMRRCGDVADGNYDDCLIDFDDYSDGDGRPHFVNDLCSYLE